MNNLKHFSRTRLKNQYALPTLYNIHTLSLAMKYLLPDKVTVENNLSNTNTEFTIMRATSTINSTLLTCTKYMLNIQFLISRRYTNFKRPLTISWAAKLHTANVHSSHETRKSIQINQQSICIRLPFIDDLVYFVVE